MPSLDFPDPWGWCNDCKSPESTTRTHCHMCGKKVDLIYTLAGGNGTYPHIYYKVEK